MSCKHLYLCCRRSCLLQHSLVFPGGRRAFTFRRMWCSRFVSRPLPMHLIIKFFARPQVEKVLYRIPAQLITQYSPVLKSMIRTLPGGTFLEGSSDENPIVLSGLKTREMEALFQFITGYMLYAIELPHLSSFILKHFYSQSAKYQASARDVEASSSGLQPPVCPKRSQVRY